MKLIQENDFKTLERLICLRQKQVKKTMSSFLKNHYPAVIETKDYIYAEGDIPVALVAHMDTVFEYEKKIYHKDRLFYDARQGVMWHPYGAGFDDRAGVFIIMKIVKDGLRPHIILTTDEECGGIGADALIEKETISPFGELKYLIQLDRANKSDCVFYSCYNPTFVAYVESFGFIEAWGTYSDISTICPEWGIAGVNLSVGYKDEHTVSETLYVNAMMATYNKVKKMLADADNIDPFAYIPAYNSYYSFYYGDKGFKCDYCGKEFYEFEVVPVQDSDGNITNLCIDCITDLDIRWCRKCGEGFIAKNDKEIFCPECSGKKSKINIK